MSEQCLNWLLPNSEVISRSLLRFFSVLSWTTAAAFGQAVDIPVPNGSFESPPTSFVNINVDYWQKTPEPPDYDSQGGFLWSQLAGIFLNTPEGQPDHIINADGKQAIWLFAVPGIGIFQDYDSQDARQTKPSHALDVIFEPGTAYRLTAALTGGGGGMLLGVPVQLSMYYRDETGTMQTAVAATLTNGIISGPSVTNLSDFSVILPTVSATNRWAGRHMGIQILSTVDVDNQGGYWDLDHVRLTAFPPPPITLSVRPTRSGTVLSWFGLGEYRYQLERSDDLNAWDRRGAPVLGMDSNILVTNTLSAKNEFYRVTAEASPHP